MQRPAEGVARGERVHGSSLSSNTAFRLQHLVCGLGVLGYR